LRKINYTASNPGQSSLASTASVPLLRIKIRMGKNPQHGMNHVQLQDYPNLQNQTGDSSFVKEIDSDDNDDSASDDDGDRGLLTGS
jgi:hypothetical protein